MTDPPRLLTPREAAQRLGVSERQLRRWRCELRGPAFLRCPRPRYLESDLDAWLAANRVAPENCPEVPSTAVR